jgi:hypothetical protein
VYCRMGIQQEDGLFCFLVIKFVYIPAEFVYFFMLHLFVCDQANCDYLTSSKIFIHILLAHVGMRFEMVCSTLVTFG